MADLRTQLRAYVEATIERVDAADVAAAREFAARPVWRQPLWRRPVVVALAAGTAVILLVGGIALLTRWLTTPVPVNRKTVHDKRIRAVEQSPCDFPEPSGRPAMCRRSQCARSTMTR